MSGTIWDVSRHDERYSVSGDATDYGALLELLERPAWHRKASCRGRTDVSWFMRPGDKPAPAIAICEICPVRRQCLTWALEQTNDLDGIWAGTTQRQRREMRRLVG